MLAPNFQDTAPFEAQRDGRIGMMALGKRVDYKKTMVLGLLLAMLGLSTVAMPVQSYLQIAGDGSRAYGTGLLEPSDAQKGWMRDNVHIVKEVKMNTLALQRLNQERALAGLPALDPAEAGAVEVGSELVYSENSEPMGDSALPTYVDNSKTVYFPPIRSQGSLGSCVAWSTTYYAFTYEINFARGRTASTGDNTMIFSPKWTYNMINYGTNNGAYFSDAFYLLTKHGAATWAQFPYDSNYLQWCLDASVWREALNSRAVSWGQIYNSDTNILIEDLKTQLANGHVMVIGTYVYSWVSSVVADDPATPADNAFVGQKIATYMKNTRQGGHGMTLVGYNDNIWCDLNGDGNVDSGEKGAFKIANSWGTGDWNAGYRWVAYDSLYSASQVHPYGSWPTTDRDSRGIFRGGDIYTLTVGASYTPKVVAEFTINSAKRGQVYMTLGLGDVTATTPSSSWYPEAIYGSGGNYAFDGTTVARDGTFVFDFTNLVPSTTAVKRWFVGLKDSTTGDLAAISSFKLYEVTAGGDVLVASSATVPKSADSSQAYVWVDYQYNSLNSPPSASLKAIPTSGYVPLAVSFDGSGSSDPDGTITQYQWTFGDGSSATGPTASHTYSSPGAYTATLTVTDNKGAKDTRSVTISVLAPVVNAPPTAMAAANLTSGLAPLWVAFDGSASSDADGSIVSYQWSFGDGTTADGAKVDHCYTAAGTYTAVLTVTDDDGAKATGSKTITVSAPPNTAPTAVAKANPTTGTAPLYVTFDGSSSSDADGSITSYVWSFGDGTSGTGATVKHTYLATGSYMAILTVTDDDGATGVASISITVSVAPNNPPKAVVKVNLTVGEAPLYVAFDGSGSSDSDGAITNYAWSFGDGGTGTGITTAHCYTTAGTFVATLTVTDDKGAQSSAQISITVSEKAPQVINPPTSLKAKSSLESVLLTWIDNSNNEDGFIIERAIKVKGAVSNFQQIGSVGVNVVSYRDTTVMPGTSYAYRVSAFSSSLGTIQAYSNVALVLYK